MDTKFTTDEKDKLMSTLAENPRTCSCGGTVWEAFNDESLDKPWCIMCRKCSRLLFTCFCDEPFVNPELTAIIDEPDEMPLYSDEPDEDDLMRADYIKSWSLAETHTFDENKDNQGKVMAGVLEDFLPALNEIAKLGSMNNKPNGKYDRGSWKLVKNPEVEYLDAWWRHVNAGRNNVDEETKMPHDVAIAWNSIVLVMFRLMREGKV